MKVKGAFSPTQAAYLDAVRRKWRDVPWTQREALIADLRGRLDELPWESSPEDALGNHDDYARLAREAAGYGAPARRFAYARAWSPRRKIVVVSTLIAAVVFGVVFSWVTHYQPVRTENLYSWSNVPSIEPNVPSGTRYWKYVPGAPVVIGTGLHNRGRRRATVTVTGVSVPSASGPFVPTGLRFTRDERLMGQWQQQTAASRVAVHPGETVFISVMMAMGHQPLCIGCAESEALPTLRLEVLGVVHSLPIAGDEIGVIGQ